MGLGAFGRLVILDLLYLDGAGSVRMWHGSARMAGTLFGPAIRLVLVAILAVLAYAVFFR